MKRAAFAGVVVAIGLSATARAADGPVAVGLVIDATDAPSLGERVRAAMHGVLDRDARVTVHDLDVGFATESRLPAADADAAKASVLLRSADIDPARAAAESARAVYEDNLVELVARDGGANPLRDLHVLLSKIRFFGGDFDGAKDVLRRAFALDPKLQYDPRTFPPQMKRTVVEARLLFEALEAGKLEVTTSPPGARVWLNGAALPGVSPVTADVAPGPNAVELRLPGYAPERRIVDFGGADNQGGHKLAVTMHHLDDPPSRAREAAATLGSGTQPAVDLEPLASSMSVEVIMLVHVTTTDSRFQLSGENYHRGHGKKNPARFDGRLERNGQNTAVEGEADTLARTLVESVGHPAKAVAASERGSGGAWQRFRRSKAFWWVVGGVGAAVVTAAAIGTGVGVYEAQQHDRALQRDVVLLGGN